MSALAASNGNIFVFYYAAGKEEDAHGLIRVLNKKGKQLEELEAPFGVNRAVSFKDSILFSTCTPPESWTSREQDSGALYELNLYTRKITSLDFFYSGITGFTPYKDSFLVTLAQGGLHQIGEGFDRHLTSYPGEGFVVIDKNAYLADPYSNSSDAKIRKVPLPQ